MDKIGTIVRDSISEFNRIYKVPSSTDPSLLSKDGSKLRFDLMKEELLEYLHAVDTEDLVGIADSLCDLLYVLLGTVESHGLTPIIDQLYNEVHRSNMSKLDEDGNPIYREDGKVVKGPNFTPPNLKLIIDNYISNTKE
jgi:predicted HAD superfamily Cof-like phosphohydrolase